MLLDQEKLNKFIVDIISETNGVSLNHTLELLLFNNNLQQNKSLLHSVKEFQELLSDFQRDLTNINEVLIHPVATALFNFFETFPLHYHEEHIHLTGSLTPEFIYPHIKNLLEGPNGEVYEQKIKEVYGEDAIPIKSVSDIEKLICLKDDEKFTEYLKILYLPKLILTTKEIHEKAAFHMASELYEKFNVGNIRLKFTLSRASNIKSEQLPGKPLTEEDVILSLYNGFNEFKKKSPNFNFVLSPCFRKESDFYDGSNYKTKKEHIDKQVDQILEILNKYPYLRPYLKEVDTVGDEKELFRKKHFEEMRSGLRKLQYNGFSIRSHHGETWNILRKGIQAVDNAMNIWHIDTLEHGISLGINPNFYFHRLCQRTLDQNNKKVPINANSFDYLELEDMNWSDKNIKEKLFSGTPLTEQEKIDFIKVKFHTAREIEHYQHDVLNRMINKKVSLIALPSSNLKLTGSLPDYKDHPFSWWEKKGVRLGVGTDNYITLKTNFIQEMLILLFSDPENLKITKLLMVTTKESRRPFIGHLLWEMKKKSNNN